MSVSVDTDAARVQASSLWPYGLLLIGSVLICCVVLELGLRLASPPPQGTPIFADFRTHIGNRTAPVGSYARSSHLGWEMRPGHSYELGGCRHDVDARGYRANDNVQYGQAEARILAVGDSFTFGHRLNNKETWPSVLERERGVRAVNAGVSGYGLDQMLVQTQRSLRRFPTTKTGSSWKRVGEDRTRNRIRAAAHSLGSMQVRTLSRR
jgi:hypothetical protein